jgi:hypothetical protein
MVKIERDEQFKKIGREELPTNVQLVALKFTEESFLQ